MKRRNVLKGLAAVAVISTVDFGEDEKGDHKSVEFTKFKTLTHGDGLILPGGDTIEAGPKDVALFHSMDGETWKVVSYHSTLPITGRPS